MYQPKPSSASSDFDNNTIVSLSPTSDDLPNLRTPMNASQALNDRSLEAAIAHLLKYGVLLASAVVLLGGILYLVRHGSEPVDYRLFQGEPDIFRSPKGVAIALLSGRRRGIIQLGIMLFIAIPIIRVAFSLLTFLRQRDFTYVIVTAVVLSGLIYSLIGAYV